MHCEPECGCLQACSTPTLLPLAWSNINGRLEGVLGSETVFLSVASSSLESGSAAFLFLSLPLMELQCLTALWMRCQAEPEPLHLRFTRRAQSRSKHSPAVHTEVETKAVTAGNRTGKNPPAAWLAAQPVWVLCFWTPTGAQSQALNMSALNSPGQKGDAGFIHLSGGALPFLLLPGGSCPTRHLCVLAVLDTSAAQP